MKITAAVTRAPHAPFVLEEVDLDSPGAGEILVRIVGAGLCHTDLVAAEGLLPITMPAVFGHEGAGVVEQVGAGVTKVKPGDNVAITFTSCGHCPRCDRNEPAYCHSMAALNFVGLRSDGSKSIQDDHGEISGNFFGQSSFATHALTTESNVVKVPDGIPLEIAGTLGCGIQTGAGAVMRSMACHENASLVVLGGGAVGLSAVMGAVLQKCRAIIVVEPSANRRELALSLGATHAIDPGQSPDLAVAVRAIAPQGVDYALDTSGIPAVIEAVPKFLAPRGTFGFVGVPPAHATSLGLPGTLREVMRGGFTYRGIIEGDSDPDVFIPQLMSLYLEGRFPFDRLIKTYPLSDINRAVAEQKQGLCVKPVLLP
ncbi:aryl-alcohol dehydrogenase XylB (plasmid) [Cupriavidus necator N-1]|uniref:Aryl-alcohol dehydrogenase XylB n=1 Tax=Cupriavidus necator (strain ATCC 43291 / DSM 13513 / CCUG 52238 / LMG 8453 / N-1) TaxID=1042878 RepID=F8GU84_CUPNN|nr:NAD(P)-dependent alcohol dehydrogenase [Cupriavidus necator]AEI82288.1 aryl-alcohol dehydrogenase XylB [Cupriavidus necator N-1]MDX6007306.1 NAD(P)-dependent alcohol dehydrogenase [Cupriavidus necator]